MNILKLIQNMLDRKPAPKKPAPKPQPQLILRDPLDQTDKFIPARHEWRSTVLRDIKEWNGAPFRSSRPVSLPFTRPPLSPYTIENDFGAPRMEGLWPGLQPNRPPRNPAGLFVLNTRKAKRKSSLI